MAEDIAQWIDSLGLGQYAQAFAENGVELQHLPHLTDGDLKELGLPLGPRRHLQTAIETLSADQLEDHDADVVVAAVGDGGVGEIDPRFARLNRGKRDSHIDPPTSSNASCKGPSPYCGENSDLGRRIDQEIEASLYPAQASEF